MPLGVATTSLEEEAALDALRDEPQPGDDQPPPEGANDAPGQVPAGDEGAAAAQPAAEGADGAPAEGEPAKTDGQPADAPGEKKGDVRAALRAARRGEQKARDRAERLQKELDELRAKATTDPAPAGDDLTDDDIEAAAADFPLVGKLAKKVKTLEAQLATTTPVPAAEANADPEFEPPPLPQNVQEVVDDIPDLLAWQHDPDQVAWQMAVAEDAKLKVHPKWKTKPLEERLAEVARRVAADIGPEPDTDPPQGADAAEVQRIAQERLAAARSRTPNSISQIGGGGGRDNQGSSLSRFMQMDDDEALAELQRGG